MSFRKLLMCAAAVLAAVACEDEDEVATTPSLDGALSFHVPAYVAPLQTVTMTPKGVEHPDGKELGYYWKVSPTMPRYDTTRFTNGLDSDKGDGKPSDGSFTHTFSDTLKTYTVYGCAYASGYLNASSQRTVQVVKGGIDGSLQNTGIEASDPKVSFEGVDYYYTRIGKLDWFRNNLARKGSGVPYGNVEVMSDVYGRYYSYEEAMTACPEGWRLPSDAEWLEMMSEYSDGSQLTPYGEVPGVAASMMAQATFNGAELWQYYPEVGDITNVSKMAVVLAGYVSMGAKSEDGGYPAADFIGLKEYAVFWTSDQVAGESDMAYCRYLFCDQPAAFASKNSRTSFGASVRCVREAE